MMATDRELRTVETLSKMAIDLSEHRPEAVGALMLAAASLLITEMDRPSAAAYFERYASDVLASIAHQHGARR